MEGHKGENVEEPQVLGLYYLIHGIDYSSNSSFSEIPQFHCKLVEMRINLGRCLFFLVSEVE